MHNPAIKENSDIYVSIIIPVFNKAEYTRECVKSLIDTLPGPGIETIIVDNGSTDSTEMYAKTLPPGFLYIKNGLNLGFAKACNLGAGAARGKYLVFLNNDTIALPNWLEEMVKTAEEEKNVGVVGSRLLFPDGTIQHAGILLAQSGSDPLYALHNFYRLPGNQPEANVLRDYQAVTGACMLIRRDIFIKVNGFDEHYINGYEDIDLCLKVRHEGYRVVYCPKSVLYHHESVSVGRYHHVRHNVACLHKRWLGKISPDAQGDSENGSALREPVSIVIATDNSINTINDCIDAILITTDSRDEIIIIDNNSNDGTREYLALLGIRMPTVKIIYNNQNVGVPRAYSMGVSQSSNKYVALLKPEVIVSKNWLLALQHFESGQIGAAAPKIMGNSLIQADYDRVNTDDCCFILPREMVNELGLFDTLEKANSDDLELSRKLQENGYKLLKAPDAVVYTKETELYPNNPHIEHMAAGNGTLTSIVIPCLNQIKYTKQCVDSILKYTAEPVELIFVNNGSSDGTGQYLKALAEKYDHVEVITNRANLGYGAACNQGINAASGHYILLLNNDTLVTEGWLTRMLASVKYFKDVGIIGPRSNEVSGVQRIVNVPYKTENELQQFARQRAMAHADSGFEVKRLVGFCMLIKKEVLDRIGGYDLRFGIGNFEDDDLCLRAQIAGYKLWVCDDVFIHHYGSITFNGAQLDHALLMRENWKKFREKWGIPENCSFESGYDTDQIINRPFNYELHYCPLEFPREKA